MNVLSPPVSKDYKRQLIAAPVTEPLILGRADGVGLGAGGMVAVCAYV